MQRYRIVLPSPRPDYPDPTILEAPSIPVALLVTDINLEHGAAEIWEGERRIARLRKPHSPQQNLWEPHQSTFWELA